MEVARPELIVVDDVDISAMLDESVMRRSLKRSRT